MQNQIPCSRYVHQISNSSGSGQHLNQERIYSLVSYSWNQLKLLNPAHVLHDTKVSARDDQVIPSGIWQNNEGCGLNLKIGM